MHPCRSLDEACRRAQELGAKNRRFAGPEGRSKTPAPTPETIPAIILALINRLGAHPAERSGLLPVGKRSGRRIGSGPGRYGAEIGARISAGGGGSSEWQLPGGGALGRGAGGPMIGSGTGEGQTGRQGQGNTGHASTGQTDRQEQGEAGQGQRQRQGQARAERQRGREVGSQVGRWWVCWIVWLVVCWCVWL